MSFDFYVFWSIEWDYMIGRVAKMIHALAGMDFSVGVHLVPGLPGGDAVGAIGDVGTVAALGANFLRIWPALALEGSLLSAWAQDGRWQPWSVDEAIDAVGQMVSMARAKSLPVIRVGIQPGHDIPVRATAGPVHPNLRGEVEMVRFSSLLEAALPRVVTDTEVVFVVHPKDLSWAKGTSNSNARHIRTSHGIETVRFRVDETVPRGTVRAEGGSS
jgi:histone acetyltransferase (RNA polymerase elongator complex component)